MQKGNHEDVWEDKGKSITGQEMNKAKGVGIHRRVTSSVRAEKWFAGCIRLRDTETYCWKT